MGAVFLTNNILCYGKEIYILYDIARFIFHVVDFLIMVTNESLTWMN